MSVIDTIAGIVSDGFDSFLRFIVAPHKVPAKLRERRRERREAEERDRAAVAAAERERSDREALVGRRGVVTRPLKTFGVIEVDGRPYDAASDRGFVEVGTVVKIVAIEGQAFRVRVDAGDAADGAP